MRLIWCWKWCTQQSDRILSSSGLNVVMSMCLWVHFVLLSYRVNTGGCMDKKPHWSEHVLVLGWQWITRNHSHEGNGAKSKQRHRSGIQWLRGGKQEMWWAEYVWQVAVIRWLGILHGYWRKEKQDDTFVMLAGWLNYTEGNDWRTGTVLHRR